MEPPSRPWPQFPCLAEPCLGDRHAVLTKWELPVGGLGRGLGWGAARRRPVLLGLSFLTLATEGSSSCRPRVAARLCPHRAFLTQLRGAGGSPLMRGQGWASAGLGHGAWGVQAHGA